MSRHAKLVQTRFTAGICAQVGPLLKQCTEGVLEGLNYLHTQNPPVVHRASAHIGQDCKVLRIQSLLPFKANFIIEELFFETQPYPTGSF